MQTENQESTFNTGSMFGLEPFLDENIPSPYEATVVALKETILLIMNEEVYEVLVRENERRLREEF